MSSALREVRMYPKETGSITPTHFIESSQLRSRGLRRRPRAGVGACLPRRCPVVVWSFGHCVVDFVGFPECFSALLTRRKTTTVVSNPIIRIYHTSQPSTSAALPPPPLRRCHLFVSSSAGAATAVVGDDVLCSVGVFLCSPPLPSKGCASLLLRATFSSLSAEVAVVSPSA